MYNIETTGQAARSSLAVASSKVQRRSRPPLHFARQLPRIIWFWVRRFREFVELHSRLTAQFSSYPLPLPELPPKKLLSSTDPALLQQRRIV